MSVPIRLHILAVPHTITRSEFSHCAFTSKVQRFGPMMRSVGFEVYHYGVEGSESGATKDFQLLTRTEWDRLRIDSYIFLHPEVSREEAQGRIEAPTFIHNELSNWDTPLAKEFRRRLRDVLAAEYRSTRTDIVCTPLPHMYDSALEGKPYVVVESGVGYENSFRNYRIFESYAWLNHTLGVEKKPPQNYWFVMPILYNPYEFPLSLAPKPLRVGYLGRIVSSKGCGIIAETAKRMPHVQFVLCGGGDPTPFLLSPNIVYKPSIHGDERGEFLGELVAFLHLCKYLEPFGSGPVEAQLCGVPVICNDSGGMVETVEQGKTGLRCHTLADICRGVEMAVEGKFDRQYIHDRAVRLYSMYTMANQYHYIFESILDVHRTEKNGWYSPDTHIGALKL
jgi:glycosyltransferase involved in cell wall biosynthesis